MIAEQIRKAALALGFAEVGFASAAPFTRGHEKLRAWVTRELHGHMRYMEDARRADPTTLLPAAKSIIVVALPYAQRPTLPIVDDVPRGVVARYALGNYYHKVINTKLHALAELISN